jgi:SAM-dependent methyltransferase
MTGPGARKEHRYSGMPAADRECWVKLYSKGSLRQLPWFVQQPYPPLVKAMEAGALLPPGPLLDVGCGFGANAFWLGKQGFRVTGIDIAPGAVAAAESRRTHGTSYPAFVEDDILASKIPSKSFRCAVDIGCFHTLPPRLRGDYADNLARILRPDATFLLFWVAREETGAWGPPHRLSVREVVEAFEPQFRIDQIVYRPRKIRLNAQIRRKQRPLAVLAGYTASLVRRAGPQPPPR